MIRNQNDRRRARTPRLSYANVVASLALMVALGGTATAAITLPKDSVGPTQIQTDAVRSPEIEADAIRSPEIAVDAVRSSEIQADAVRSSDILNDTILLADIAPDARAALDEPRVRVAEESDKPVPACDDLGGSFDDCPNITSISLPAGRWLVHAKFSLIGSFGISGSRCALVHSDTTTMDVAGGLGFGAGLGSFDSEQVSLSDVLTTAPNVDSTVVAVRCSEHSFADLEAKDVALTAVEVKPVTAE